jgi:hypothetical protein
MKGYKLFIFLFAALLSLYILAELNRPKAYDWSVTLSKEDKNPYGAFVLYRQLQDLFPASSINSYQLPVYNQINNREGKNTAYLLIEPELDLTAADINELLNYVVNGNYLFITSGSFSKSILDSFKIKISRRLDLLGKDSVSINFSNPLLRTPKDYSFPRMTMDGYFSSLDTSRVVVLGTSGQNHINFIKIPYGEGALFIHASPLCFSNYFILKNNNAGYTAKALSYIPGNVTKIYWDEYYKMGQAGSQNPLRFILTNPYMRWAFRIAVLAIVLFIIFEMKRRQRIIPVIPPLQNTTLDFVRTVGNVYFNQHDNKNIAFKKINYFFEFIRSRFYLSTSQLNEEFINVLAKKSGIQVLEIEDLVKAIQDVNSSALVNDELLIYINKKIDIFYTHIK